MSYPIYQSGSINLPIVGGGSQKIAVSAVSAQSAAISNHATVYIYTDVGVSVRQGTNPTAVNDGTDLYIPAGSWRLVGIEDENKLAFICNAGDSGNVYLTEGA